MPRRSLPPEETPPLTDTDALSESKIREALSAADMAELSPAENIGDPTAASQETGETLVAATIGDIRLLVEALNAPEETAN